MNNKDTFLRLDILTNGPDKNFDLTSDFFLMDIEELLSSNKVLPPMEVQVLLTRIHNCLDMSPFSENLYLNPLYSIRGGSTTRQLPFVKKPIEVLFLLKPL